MSPRPYDRQLKSSDNLVTTHKATCAGFVDLASEKNRRATPYVAEARALQEAVSHAKTPTDLLKMQDIKVGLLTATGLSDEVLGHLLPEDREEAIKVFAKNFLEPAGASFVEELVFRFLLMRGSALGNAMRDIGNALAQRRLTRAIISTLTIAGIKYRWQHAVSKEWVIMSDDDSEIELRLRGLAWQRGRKQRTVIFNLTVPLVKNNVDFCLFNLNPEKVESTNYATPESYLALGELKGGIDPAGADEHWKTARTALERVRAAFAKSKHAPYTFFVGAAVEKKMANEIWDQLERGTLSNAANLNDEKQIASLSHWLCTL